MITIDEDQNAQRNQRRPFDMAAFGYPAEEARIQFDLFDRDTFYDTIPDMLALAVDEGDIEL